jgi:hypothetical protein
MPIAPARHVHVASVDGDLVFLDAVRDEYLCLGRDAARPIIARLTGASREIDDLEALLFAQGLIVGCSLPAWPGNPPATAHSDLG